MQKSTRMIRKMIRMWLYVGAINTPHLGDNLYVATQAWLLARDRSVDHSSTHAKSTIKHYGTVRMRKKKLPETAKSKHAI